MPGENLTRVEAQERRTIIDPQAGSGTGISYEVSLDLNRGAEVFGSRTVVRFAATPGASTFIAHVFAEGVARRVSDGKVEPTRSEVLGHLRDSVPILTSALLPCAILLLGLIGWLEPRTAQLIAEIVILLRIGGTVFVIDRLNNERPSRATLFSSGAVTLVATVIVAIKVVVTH